MTYKVGDIVNFQTEVVRVSHTGQIQLKSADTDYYIWVDPSEITLVERPKRELKPGDRAVCTGDPNYPNREYVWTGETWVNTAPFGEHYSRDELTFDSEPEVWTYYPRNETPEA